MKCPIGLTIAHFIMTVAVHYSTVTLVTILIRGTKTLVIEARVLV